MAFPLWQRALLLALGYFLCAWLGSQLSAPGSTNVTFWLPAGLFVAVLLLNPTRHWLWLALAVFPAAVAFEISRGLNSSPVLILFFYFSNVVRSVFGAWLVRRFVAETPTFVNLKEFWGFMGLAGILSAALGATFGVLALWGLGLGRLQFFSWCTWWTGSAMAVLVFSPLLLTWLGRSKEPSTASFSIIRKLEAGLLFGGMSLLAWYFLVCGHGVNSPKVPLLIFILWAGLRFGVRGASLAIFWLALLMAYLTTHYLTGLSKDEIVSGNYLVTMQVFLAVGAFVGLIPAIILADHDRITVRLRESEERLNNLTAAAFEGIFISENGRILDVNDQGLKMFGYDRREMIGKEILELVTPACRATVSEAIIKKMESISGISPRLRCRRNFSSRLTVLRSGRIPVPAARRYSGVSRSSSPTSPAIRCGLTTKGWPWLMACGRVGRPRSLIRSETCWGHLLSIIAAQACRMKIIVS